jgi:hypothetical protein
MSERDESETDRSEEKCEVERNNMVIYLVLELVGKIEK